MQACLALGINFSASHSNQVYQLVTNNKFNPRDLSVTPAL